MSESGGDRRHAATPTRLQRARQDGDIPKSFELATAFQMLGTTLVAYLTFHQVGSWLTSITIQNWETAGNSLAISTPEITAQLQNLLGSAVIVLLPMLGLIFLIGIGSHWLQTGPMFLSNKVMPDVTRLGPGNWKRQTFSMSSMASLLVGIPKTTIAAAVFGGSIYCHQMEFFNLAGYSIDVMVSKMFALILTVTLQVGLALFVVSIADYGLKYVGHRRRIRMTDEELREELRTQDGTGQVRNRQRQLNRV